MVSSINSQLSAHIQESYKRLAESSDKLSKAFGPTGSSDIVAPIQEIKSVERDIVASLKTIKIVSKLEDQVLDILA